MEQIKREQALNYNCNGYSSLDYPSKDNDINSAIIKIEKRSPEIGYQANTAWKELLYILNGQGDLFLKNKEPIKFHEKDVLVIDQNECYAFDGNFEAAVSCIPAWDCNQQKYIKEWNSLWEQ